MSRPGDLLPLSRSTAPTGTLGAERERVVQVLCVHFAADHLDMAQLDARLSSAYQAQSAAELQRIVADLPVLPVAALDPGAATVVPPMSVPARGVVLAFMGGGVRKGSWLVPRHLKVVAVMGGAEIDLRDAHFAPGLTEIDVMAVMGGVEVIVPHGVRVDVVGGAFMGGFEVDTDDVVALDESRPVLRVSGLALMAGVEVKVRRPKQKMLQRFTAAWKAATARRAQ